MQTVGVLTISHVPQKIFPYMKLAWKFCLCQFFWCMMYPVHSEIKKGVKSLLFETFWKKAHAYCSRPFEKAAKMIYALYIFFNVYSGKFKKVVWKVEAEKSFHLSLHLLPIPAWEASDCGWICSSVKNFISLLACISSTVFGLFFRWCCYSYTVYIA